ncbi:4'-phosphopantetheinyl transferase superfamily protein [Kribbella sp. NPDC003557]|uniref:4'-phosphopantetheinyl transferase family protein n=1 Tax=Kribbella sp. NPDC003557 TaxID=3154449 RepID=UPI0033AC6742
MRLSQVDEALDAATARLLEAEERTRAAAYRLTDDRLRFQVGVAVTRLALAAEMDCRADEIRLDRTCPDCGRPHGKVRVAGPRPGWEVSVSHSGDLIGVAVGTIAPLGLDVEQIRAVEAAVAPLVLTPSEERQVRTAADFIRFWTRKEAVVKATEDGLRQPLNLITVTAPTEPPRLLAWTERDPITAGIQLHDLADRNGHLASLAVLSPDEVTITEHDAQPLLRA